MIMMYLLFVRKLHEDCETLVKRFHTKMRYGYDVEALPL